ncbi:MAG: porin [Fodinibius sp.]|nr:porin [Fodinibius sp.]
MISIDTKCIKRLSLLAILLFAVTSLGTAQQETGGDLEELRQAVKNDYFSVGMLIQNVVDYQPERRGGNNGFSISNARVQVYGELDNKFGYQLQANVINSPAILDANLNYNFNEQTSLKAGLFKTPFSAEYLTGAAAIDFVNRSTAVKQLAPNRQVGLQLGGSFSDGVFQYKAGIFNGNRFSTNQNNDNTFIYVGRLQANLGGEEQSSGDIKIGLNASYEDKQYAFGSNIQSNFEGTQTLLGSDLRYTNGGFLLSGEFIYSWLESDTGFEFNPYGYYATAGYYVTSETQLLLRWDDFQADNLASDSRSIIAGVNIFPSAYSEVQLNYIIPTEQAIDYSQLLLNLQLNF